MINARMARRALILIALIGLTGGIAVKFVARPELAQWLWAAGAIPVVVSLAISIVRDLRAGRMGVDAVALLAMVAALALGEALAAIVVPSCTPAAPSLRITRSDGPSGTSSRSSIAPRTAHRKTGESFEDIAIEEVAVGDTILVRAGEVVPVDGQIASPSASLDEFGCHGRADPRDAARWRGGAQRRDQCGRDLRDARVGDRRGEHLRRHR